MTMKEQRAEIPIWFNFFFEAPVKFVIRLPELNEHGAWSIKIQVL